MEKDSYAPACMGVGNGDFPQAERVRIVIDTYNNVPLKTPYEISFFAGTFPFLCEKCPYSNGQVEFKHPITGEYVRPPGLYGCDVLRYPDIDFLIRHAYNNSTKRQKHLSGF